ncbi:hypothetical protein NX773_17535 [Massilia solisilvae]|uniref:PcRGLX/YetA-like N-terminal RIFT barrel domain-containing protein n=1 Tax=Massilia solisilvae TaxID=1811225 RepID=A0ABT2BN79_9BURK|nr:hypothetical protein [Massilia solisilvae]MCS0609972.1 hypothetical protein [Massilia solisilvae]
MKFPLHTSAGRVLPAILLASSLAACGGGSDPQAGNATVLAAEVSNGTATTTASGTSAAVQGVLTDVRFENTNPLVAQANVPVTFGQVFAQGALNPADGLVGRLPDGTTVPLQVDVKALHADGSVRHAVISAVLPSLAAGQTNSMSLVKSGTAASAGTSTPDDLLGAGFSASVHATINGVRYEAFADDLLKEGPYQTWLSGPVASEWQVSAPLTAADGTRHPHLSARFAIRWYPGASKARVDVTVENDWAYEPNPQNITYDASVLVGAKEVYAKTGLNHLNHARWRKVFWYNGTAPEVNVKHNAAYLIATRALPNYDQTVTIPEARLAALQTRWTGAITEPMGIGLATAYMPQTGGRDDIGLLPGWAATWLLSMDKRARDVTLGTADGAGSWSAHYRDKNTGRPVSLIDYPYMTILGRIGDTYNPVTKKYEAFPACASSTACTTPYTHDSAHTPNLAYLPYLLTGDYYYLEELQFWAMWAAFSSNPGYRQNVKGLVLADQVRGQAWTMRTVAEAAYITPDNDRLKAHFTQIVNSNLDWFNQTYTNNASANQLGIIVNGYSLVYNNGTGMAPWQDDFFTSAIGHAAELGFAKAQPLLAWKSKFPVSRMTADGACWVDGSIYTLIVRDSSTSPYYATMGQAYKTSHTATFNALSCASAEMATALKLKVGEMTGYSAEATGYPSNLQPALAYAADALGAPGKSAWTVFMNRSVKPNYGLAPQFAIVPR